MQKKWVRRWFRKLFRRRFYVAALLVLQCVFLVWMVLTGSRLFYGVNLILKLVSAAAVLSIVSKRDKGMMKTVWVVLILSMPLFGGLLYLLFHFQSSVRRLSKNAAQAHREALPFYALGKQPKNDAPEQELSVRYLRDHAGFLPCTNSQTVYLPSGQAFWRQLLQDLETAQRYIFLEYFIIEEGQMWNEILEVLSRKAAQGVTVRVIYDDMGCFLTLPHDYPQQLRARGIECQKFNPFRPFLSATQNNRDHRKIAVIDGTTAFTGGINLADEYINAVNKFGRWRDAGLRVQGDAAWSFTLMFLEMWALCTQKPVAYAEYCPRPEAFDEGAADGLVVPYADSPMDADNTSEHVYLQIINNAKEYLYISTPYLIVDDSMLSALTLAAKSGVDVRILTPQRWDRWPIHMTTRSYYRDLLCGGVKIIEYSGGFNHAKTFVSDDRTATVGTVNLDFRSLYLHFECGALLLGGDTVQQIRKDFLQTAAECHEVTLEECTPNLFVRSFQNLLRLFAPLM